MDPFHFKYAKLVILSISTLVVFPYCCYCHVDPNLSAGWECSDSEAGNSTAANSSLYQTNLNNLLNTLSENAPLHNGFYKATSGEYSNKIYGLVQCRGDVSAQDCANCTKQSIKTGMSECPKSNQVVTVWFRWCLLRYSVDNFFGDLDRSKHAIIYATRSDDLNTTSRGINLMSGLAATAPKQPLMFQTAIVDVGKRGKRFGMAQCTRDMSRSNCGKCLTDQAEFFKSAIGFETMATGFKTGTEVYGKSCSMWYNDYQFYFNISTVATNGAKRSSEYKGAAVGITLATLGFLSVL